MKRMTGASTLALVAMTGWAQADVTPQQVWDNLEQYLTGFGYDVTATEALDGDTLTVSDITFLAPMPEGTGAMSVELGEIVLTGRGDGTVSVAFPETMPIRIRSKEGAEPVDITLDYTQQNLQMIVSGTPEAMDWDYTADQLGFSMDGVGVTDDSGAEASSRFEATMGPVRGNSDVTSTDGTQTIVQSADFGDLRYEFAVDEAGSGGGIFTGTMTGLAMEGTTTIPEGIDMEDMVAALQAGFGGSGRFTHQGGQLSFSVDNEGDITRGETTSTSGVIDVSITSEGLRYLLGGTGTTLSMTVPNFPFPISAQWAESGFDLLMPATASETPQDAALGITLSGFTMADALWALFDPGSVLPRDPATVVIDLAAQVTPFVSLLDPEAMTGVETDGTVPGELNALTLETLRIEAAGAQLTGTGDFTFDNSDLETLGGFPRPAGKIDLAVKGQNALIDRLIQMGLLAEEDAMGARMMLGMFTVPASEPDSATSTIEVTDEFHIIANGQRIQ